METGGHSFQGPATPNLQNSRDVTNLDPIYNDLTEQIATFEESTGQNIDVLLPADTLTGAGFLGVDLTNGRLFIARVLCDGKHDVRMQIEAAAAGGLPTLIPAVAAMAFTGVAALNPLVMPIVAGVAAVIIVRGIDGFCADMGKQLGNRP